MTQKIFEDYDKLQQDLWHWIVKYGYTETPDGSRPIKKDPMWQEVFEIQATLDDLNDELKSKIESLPEEVIYEIAKKILIPSGIDLDEVVHRHIKDF